MDEVHGMQYASGPRGNIRRNRQSAPLAFITTFEEMRYINCYIASQKNVVVRCFPVSCEVCCDLYVRTQSRQNNHFRKTSLLEAYSAEEDNISL